MSQEEESSSSLPEQSTRPISTSTSTNTELQILTFLPSDPSDPRNFSFWRKWSIVGSITLIDLTVSWGASGYSPAQEDLTSYFNVSSEVGVLGLSLYVLGLALGPMTLAPLSEYYGRSYLYIIPYGTFLLFLLGTALVQNIEGFLILRFLSGLFASVTIANFGGTIADLWPRDQIGPAMSTFLWASVCGSPSGFFLMSFVAQTRGWRDIFWALLGICGGFWLILVIVLLGFKNETRHAVILRRRANRMNKAAGRNVATVPIEMQSKTLGKLVKDTLSRPFRFLMTEPVIVFAALYNGFLYGLSFLFNSAFHLVFGKMGYGFNTMDVGLCFLGLIIGISLGPIINVWQEHHYQYRVRAAGFRELQSEEALDPHKNERFKNIPEARVQLSKLAAILLPISLFWFAWTSPPQYHIPFIVPILATTLFGYSFYTLILMTYLYVEDSYMVFSASALAGVGLIRNLAGAGFPLFGKQLFTNLGYNWAGTVLACLAILLVPIPFILERWGPRLRARSEWARLHVDD